MEGSLRRRHIPQQGEGIRVQIGGLHQLRVEIGGKQLADFIFAAGGVHQIGGQSGVEHEALCVQAVFQQRPHEVLDVMAHFFNVGGEQGVQQRVPVTGVALEEKFRRQGGIRPGIAVRNDAGEVRQGQHRHMIRLAEQFQHFLRPVFLCHALRRHGDVRRGIRRSRFLWTQAHFFNQLGKFQLQKQGIRRRCRLLHPVFRRVEGQRRISDNGGQPVGMAGGVLSRRQLFDGGGLGVDIRKLFINGVHAAIFLNKIHSGLFTHPRYAGDIVGGVSHEGLQVDHVDGFKAVLLPEGLRGHILGGSLAHTGGHQLHLRMVGDKLEGILISRHHYAVPARRLAFPGNGADQVIGLPPLHFIAGDVQGIQHLFQHRHLHPQFLRHGLPGGLVRLVRLVTEGRGVEVEGDAQGIRPFFLFQAQQRGEKAEHGVGVQPFPVSQGANAVIGPVDDGVAVNDHALHGKTSGFF